MAKLNVLERRTRDRLIRLEAFQKAKEEAEAVATGIDESVRLAADRGEQIETAKGRITIKSRDGLRLLFDAYKITEEEYRAGQHYRQCFETLQSSPRSNLNREQQGGTGQFQEVRAFRAMRLSEMEGMAKGRQLTALRLCAGEGRPLRHFSKGGADHALNLKALRVVLVLIADRYKLRLVG